MIICEKPLAQNVREALAIKKLLDTSKTVFVLNYQRRFSPLFAGMRRDIQTGKLGRIQQVSCYYSNGLYNNGGHAIDALSYLLDDSIVTARGLKNEHNRTYYNDDFNIDGILETKKGTRISMQSLDQHAYGIHDIHIFGEKGDILISAYGQTAVRRSARPSMFAGIQQLDSKTEKVVSRPLSATKDALVHAIDCYEHKKKPKSGIENGVDTMRILDALARSARSGGKRILL
jgi:predicted dehydrogenase